MGIKCSNCSFDNNPAGSHYCGACGKRLNSSEDWRLYNWMRYTPVADTELKRLREIEQKHNASLWKRIDNYLDEHDWAAATLIIVGMGVLIVLGMWLFSKCDGPSQETAQATYKYAPYKVDDKFGIGTDADNLAVPAAYDTIFPTGSFEAQFFIKNHGSSKNAGMAWVSDTLVNVIEPKYDGIHTYYFSKVCTAKTTDASGRNVYDLLDPQGRTISGGWASVTGFGGVNNAIAWAAKNHSDYYRNKYSLIDNRGNVIFQTPYNSLYIEPNEGLAMYKQYNTSTYHAIDASGSELFTFNADELQPFHDGLAAFFRGTDKSTRKLGFIDRSGRIVVQPVYTAFINSPTFDSQGFCKVKYNGRSGKIDRSGTFTAD